MQSPHFPAPPPSFTEAALPGCERRQRGTARHLRPASLRRAAHRPRPGGSAAGPFLPHTPCPAEDAAPAPSPLPKRPFPPGRRPAPRAPHGAASRSRPPPAPPGGTAPGLRASYLPRGGDRRGRRRAPGSRAGRLPSPLYMMSAFPLPAP